MKKATIFVRILMVWAAVSPLTAFVQQPSAEQLVRGYYTAYEKKDWGSLEQILADGFTFSSPVDDHINIKEYKMRCWPNCQNIKKFDVVKLVVSGDDAFVTYNGWTNDGKLFRNTEYFKLKDGKILSNECFFGPGINYPNNKEKQKN